MCRRDRGGGDEVPLLLAVERRDLDAAGDGLAGEGADLGQGTLDTVVDVFQHTGAELHRQRQTRGDDLGAGEMCIRDRSCSRTKSLMGKQ